MRDLTVSNAARIAGEQSGVDKGPIEVAELAAQFSHEELILREALGLSDDVEISPSGGALAANPVIATGLIRIGEAANQIIDGGRKRVLGHASAGPCLQQNLVCVLEGD
jgi:acetyl-CoA acetyltransferase